MNTTPSIIIRCTICAVIFTALASCKRQAPPEATSTKVEAEPAHDTSSYEPQPGDRVRLTGVFKSTKGYMGVVKGILIPHFCNRDEEVLKYKGKRVKVIGTLSKPSYPPESDGNRKSLVQRWLGLQLELESIEILTNEDVTQEKVEKLSRKKDGMR